MGSTEFQGIKISKYISELTDKLQLIKLSGWDHLSRL